jgi:DNA-binding XRE family transcriptional regulator
MEIKIDNNDRPFLREWRLAKGMTQSDLAKRAETGKSEISRLEKGSRQMSLIWLNKLTRAMGISREDLMKLPPMGFGQVSPPPPESVRFVKNDWSMAMLGEIQLGVQGDVFQVVPYSGDDWPGMFTPGDILIVDKRKTATSVPGIYAITAGDEIIIRRIVHAGGEVILSCGNPAYQPTGLSEGLAVAGRVVGHIRRM